MDGPAHAACPSCGSAFAGPYCHQCGEERMDGHAWSWGHFMHHLVHEIAHVDSKIFRSFRLLIASPGFLTSEYWAGRRVPYLRPLRIYLITAAIHFVALHYGWFRMDIEFAVNQRALSPIHAAARVAGLAPELDAQLTQRFESIYKFALYLGPLVLAGISWTAFRRHRPYYIQHLIFAIHVYSVWFLLSMFSASVYTRGIFAAAFLGYLFFAARRLYGGGAAANAGRALTLRLGHLAAEFLVIAVTIFIAIASAHMAGAGVPQPGH